MIKIFAAFIINSSLPQPVATAQGSGASSVEFTQRLELVFSFLIPGAQAFEFACRVRQSKGLRTSKLCFGREDPFVIVDASILEGHSILRPRPEAPLVSCARRPGEPGVPKRPAHAGHGRHTAGGARGLEVSLRVRQAYAAPQGPRSFLTLQDQLIRVRSATVRLSRAFSLSSSRRRLA